VTKEEIAEGRQLLATYRRELEAFRASGAALSHPLTHATEELQPWLFDHASELLSLAEEARWRHAQGGDYLPEKNVRVLVLTGYRAEIGYRNDDYEWVISNGEPGDTDPTHWRPLPRFGGE
jgi:hypothetical protein